MPSQLMASQGAWPDAVYNVYNYVHKGERMSHTTCNANKHQNANTQKEVMT